MGCLAFSSGCAAAGPESGPGEREGETRTLSPTNSFDDLEHPEIIVQTCLYIFFTFALHFSICSSVEYVSTLESGRQRETLHEEA